jgi:hypothetical protein
MRQTISGLVAAFAVMAASSAPALACGGLFDGGCAPCNPCGQTYVQTYSGCATCGAHERLSDPEVQYHSAVVGSPQYYYVNQGPTYTGAGDFAPYPTYQEAAVSGWNTYRVRPYHYGYDGGRYANATNHYYDGAGIDGPRVFTYHAHRHYPWHHHYWHRYGYHYRHHVLHSYY